jgi:hypothetical protein
VAHLGGRVAKQAAAGSRTVERTEGEPGRVSGSPGLQLVNLIPAPVDASGWFPGRAFNTRRRPRRAFAKVEGPWFIDEPLFPGGRVVISI